MGVKNGARGVPGGRGGWHGAMSGNSCHDAVPRGGNSFDWPLKNMKFNHNDDCDFSTKGETLYKLKRNFLQHRRMEENEWTTRQPKGGKEGMVQKGTSWAKIVGGKLKTSEAVGIELQWLAKVSKGN